MGNNQVYLEQGQIHTDILREGTDTQSAGHTNKEKVMEEKIKAIPTVYNGYKFRSRLEARWAVFFDSLGIKYLYEPEGVILRDGTYYLPDFYLPEVILRHGQKGLFIEVKGVFDTRTDDIIASLWDNCPDDVYTDYPLPVLFVGAIPKDFEEIEREHYCSDVFYDFGLVDGDHGYPAWITKTFSNHFYLIGPDNGIPEYPDQNVFWESKEHENALLAARQARFEFEDRRY